MAKTIRMLCILLGLLASASATSAQIVRGGINGTVKDESGGVLPGVSVKISSPALQSGEMEAVTGVDGTYSFLDLPIGVFKAQFQLSGFTGIIRENIELPSAFVARIDAEMKVGAMEESVTVSAQSPVVDVTSTRGGGVVSAQMIEALPVNKNHQDMMLLAPGALVSGPPMTAAVGFGAVFTSTLTYGLPGQQTARFDGLDVSSAGEHPDFSTGAEIDVKTYGGGADIHTAGVNLNTVVKTGGNEFHGRAEAQLINDRFNSTNVDDALRAQGLSAGNALVYHYDFPVELGGRILRDRLWFFAAFRNQSLERTIVGYSESKGADGKYGTIDDVTGVQPQGQRNETIKLSYQATQKHHFVGLYARQDAYEKQAQGTRFKPYENTTRLHLGSQPWKLEWQGVLTNRLLINVLGGNTGYIATYDLPTIYGDANDSPSTLARARLDRATTFQTGPEFIYGGHFQRGLPRRELIGSVTWTPEKDVLGSHVLKFGGDLFIGSQFYRSPSYAGDYQLVYDTIGGVPMTPQQINIKDRPVHGDSNQNYSSVYASDEWRVHPRLTANLALRWENQHFFLPAQTKAPSTWPFAPYGDFPEVELAKWQNFAPRAGLAYDLSGDGKTVVKGTVGIFHDDPTPSFSSTYNPNAIQSVYTFRWVDRNGDNDYTPGEVNLDLNGPDFVSLTGPRSLSVDPDLKAPTTMQATASVEHELFPGIAARGLWVYYKRSDQIATINRLRPYSAWNIPLTRRDPGPNGVLNDADDEGSVTIYDYDPAYRGAAFVKDVTVNSTDRGDSYNNFELTITKRATAKWSAFGTFLATKSHQWIVLIPQNPNEEVNSLNENWQRSARGSFSYLFPWQINASAVYQIYSGLPRQRTNLFRAADPDGGTPLRQEATVTLKIEPVGEHKGPVRSILNLRASKRFTFGRSNIEVAIQSLNALNANPAWGAGAALSASAIVDASGPTYNYVTRIPEPRALRFTASYTF